MTPEQIRQVRARLAGMQALCEATNLLQSLNSFWYQMGDWCLSEAGSDQDAAFIAAASPALMLRLIAHAEHVLDRHHCPPDAWCEVCREVWPCPEVAAVIKAWTP